MGKGSPETRISIWSNAAAACRCCWCMDSRSITRCGQGQLQELAGHARVLAPDLRGFGRSAASGEVVTMEQFADDLAALLDARGIHEPVVFCGLSMGGYIGWQFFRRHRSRLRGLILCDTRAVADTPAAAEARLVNAERVLAEGLGFLADGMLDKLFAAETAPAPAGSGRGDATRHVGRLAPGRRGCACAAWPPVPTCPLGCRKSTCRRCSLCGREDAISTVEEMRGIAQCLPQARFVEVAGAGHMSPLEQPRLVNAAIREFLNALRSGRRRRSVALRSLGAEPLPQVLHRRRIRFVAKRIGRRGRRQGLQDCRRPRRVAAEAGRRRPVAISDRRPAAPRSRRAWPWRPRRTSRRLSPRRPKPRTRTWIAPG